MIYLKCLASARSTAAFSGLGHTRRVPDHRHYGIAAADWSWIQGDRRTCVELCRHGRGGRGPVVRGRRGGCQLWMSTAAAGRQINYIVQALPSSETDALLHVLTPSQMRSYPILATRRCLRLAQSRPQRAPSTSRNGHNSRTPRAQDRHVRPAPPAPMITKPPPLMTEYLRARPSACPPRAPSQGDEGSTAVTHVTCR